MSAVAVSTSQLAERAPKLTTEFFAAIGDRVAAEAAHLTPKNAALLVQAFSRVDQRHGLLLFHLPMFVAAKLTDFTFEDVSKILSSFAKFSLPDQRLLDTVIPALPGLIDRELLRWEDSLKVSKALKDTDDMMPVVTVSNEGRVDSSPCSVTCFVDCLESFARFYIPTDTVTTPQFDAICARSAETTSVDRERIATAVSTLQIEHIGWSKISDEHKLGVDGGDFYNQSKLV
jgi:hypothetical protein